MITVQADATRHQAAGARHQPAGDRPHGPSPVAPGPALLEGLVDTLRTERRLIDDLRAAMERQRAAIAADDLQGLDDSVFGIQRVLLTLNEAKKRRRTLTERLGCDVETAPRDLCDALGHQATDGVRRASQDLEDAARALSREVAVNKEVLRQGIAAGEEYIRLLAGVQQRRPGYPERNDAAGPGPRLVNRQA